MMAFYREAATFSGSTRRPWHNFRDSYSRNDANLVEIREIAQQRPPTPPLSSNPQEMTRPLEYYQPRYQRPQFLPPVVTSDSSYSDPKFHPRQNVTSSTMRMGHEDEERPREKSDARVTYLERHSRSRSRSPESDTVRGSTSREYQRHSTSDSTRYHGSRSGAISTAEFYRLRRQPSRVSDILKHVKNYRETSFADSRVVSKLSVKDTMVPVIHGIGMCTISTIAKISEILWREYGITVDVGESASSVDRIEQLTVRVWSTHVVECSEVHNHESNSTPETKIQHTSTVSSDTKNGDTIRMEDDGVCENNGEDRTTDVSQYGNNNNNDVDTIPQKKETEASTAEIKLVPNEDEHMTKKRKRNEHDDDGSVESTVVCKVIKRQPRLRSMFIPYRLNGQICSDNLICVSERTADKVFCMLYDISHRYSTTVNKRDMKKYLPRYSVKFENANDETTIKTLSELTVGFYSYGTDY